MKQLIHLDPGELFTQLAATTMLVEPGRKSRWYLSSAVVSEGVIRLFRPWLAEQAGKQSIFSREESIDWKDDQRGTVWVNDGKNVGVRFNVREHRWRRENPILVHSDEEVAVSYEVQFEGKHTHHTPDLDLVADGLQQKFTFERGIFSRLLSNRSWDSRVFLVMPLLLDRRSRRWVLSRFSLPVLVKYGTVRLQIARLLVR